MECKFENVVCGVSDARKKNHGKSLLMLHHEMQIVAEDVKFGKLCLHRSLVEVKRCRDRREASENAVV